MLVVTGGACSAWSIGAAGLGAVWVLVRLLFGDLGVLNVLCTQTHWEQTHVLGLLPLCP